MRTFRQGFIAIALIAALSACDSGKKVKDQTDQAALDAASRAELEAAISERDQLIQVMNEISENLQQIKQLEGVVSIAPAGEMPSNASQINSDIEALKASLEERRNRLNDLEAKLKNSNLSNQNLLNTIASLREQIEEQSNQIAHLKENLRNANDVIDELDTKVENLATQVTEVTQQRDEAQDEAIRQTDINNECYYAVGTKSELKNHNIIEGGGFLKKSKIMQGEFDLKFFTKADKRTLQSIPLHSKKAKVITTYQPSDSYEIVDVDGQKVLRILNPTDFWDISNYLVIQID